MGMAGPNPKPAVILRPYAVTVWHAALDHVVHIVLLVADATCRKECVDAHDTGQVDAWLVGEDIATAGRLWGVQACWLVSLHFGRMRTDIHRDLASSARQWGDWFAQGAMEMTGE